MKTRIFRLRLLLLAGVAYTILTRALIARHGRDSTLAIAVGADRKGWASIALYAIGIDPKLGRA